MCVSRRFARLEHVPFRDRAVAHDRTLAPEAELPGQRVDQPRLPARLRPHHLHPPGRERLARLGRVLAKHGPDIAPREIPQPQRLGLDAEGTAPRDHLPVRNS